MIVDTLNHTYHCSFSAGLVRHMCCTFFVQCAKGLPTSTVDAVYLMLIGCWQKVRGTRWPLQVIAILHQEMHVYLINDRSTSISTCSKPGTQNGSKADA